MKFLTLFSLGLVVLLLQVFSYTSAHTWRRNSKLVHTNRPPKEDLAECISHTDCPDHLACYTDSKCRDACTFTAHDLQCATNARCSVIKHQPTCVCNPGFYGDGVKACSTSIIRKRRCAAHSDCPDHLACFLDGVCRDVCIHGRLKLHCAENAVCEMFNHIPRCSVPRI